MNSPDIINLFIIFNFLVGKQLHTLSHSLDDMFMVNNYNTLRLVTCHIYLYRFGIEC